MSNELNTRSARAIIHVYIFRSFSKCSMSAACCLEQVVSILIWDCCALQISISSALIRCCVSSEVWMFLKLRLVVYASRIYPGVLTCNDGTCMLSGRYVSSALLRRSVAKLLNRSYTFTQLVALARIARLLLEHTVHSSHLIWR